MPSAPRAVRLVASLAASLSAVPASMHQLGEEEIIVAYTSIRYVPRLQIISRDIETPLLFSTLNFSPSSVSRLL
ncbi:hypothetical protein TgHK011_008872 [Trichoderma gracile]|nr:hypothetical protein TgHK011_008872 [Trichoderma gracile]